MFVRRTATDVVDEAAGATLVPAGVRMSDPGAWERRECTGFQWRTDAGDMRYRADD